MIRLRTLLTVVAFTLLVAGVAVGHELEVLFDRKDPVVVPVRYRKIVKVQFWEAVLDVSTTIPKESLDIRRDDDFHHTIKLTNIAKKTRGMLYVTTVSGVVIHMDIRHWGNSYQLIRVKDARTEVERAVQRATETSKLSPEERAVRQLWRAQWGFPADAAVQVQDLNVLAERNDFRDVTIIKRYETVGFYGFTQKVTNRSPDVMVLHPATVELGCPLFSVALDGHEPALKPGDDPHRIVPGGSVLVHLTCKGARRAAIR